jgi:hypothetical protein
MEQESQDLWNWVQSVSEYRPVQWDRLPELELYMDQVITLMNKELAPFSTNGERLLSPSMINNYVKDGVLPRPEQKKYSRDHLAMLLMICMLKSVLLLPEIDTTLHGLTKGRSIGEVYPDFAKLQAASIDEITKRINETTERDEESLYRLAMNLALEANARRIAAARILDSLSPKEIKELKEPKESKRAKSKKE